MSVAVSARSHVAGATLRPWGFAVRIWAATMLALYAAFWLQIDGAASAATCVAILALQTRGQAYQKALYRLLGTAVGVLAAVALTALFSQARDLFILALAGWVALSVFVAGLLDGNRAYGAQLSGYTVAIVAVQLIDSPGQVFLASLNRGAANVVGIVAIALVNDLLAAPDLRASLTGRLRALRAQVRDLAAQHRDDDAGRDVAAARLLAGVAALHADITALPSESVGGGARGAAARRAAAGLVHGILAARSEAGTAVVGPEPGPAVRAADEAVAAALADLETGRGGHRRISLPIFRSQAAAARNALRTFIVLIVAGALFAMSGWPSASLAFSLVAVTMALSSTAPNPRAFALGAAIAMPLAIVAAGVTEFLVLDGVADFPLLAIAMAPTITAACLLVATGKPPLAPIGFLLLVFFPVFLSPANPQSYNPQSYLFTATLALASVAVLFIGLTTVLPTDDRRRRQWLLGSARAELLAVLEGRRSRRPEDLLRDADRIAQAAAPRTGASGSADLAALFWMAEIAEAAGAALAALADSRHDHRADVRCALRTLDAPYLLSCADRLPGLDLAPALVRAARLIETRPTGIERVLGERPA